MSGLGSSQTLGEVTKIPGSGRFSRIVNHFESEAEREQFVLAANGPFSRKAEALFQPEHRLEARDRSLRRGE
jgi:hypothetical protein